MVISELDPAKTDITVDIRNSTGVVIGDALDLLDRAIARWQEVFARFAA